MPERAGIAAELEALAATVGALDGLVAEAGALRAASARIGGRGKALAAVEAHGLRSPMTAIRSAAEILAEGVGAGDRRRFREIVRAEAARLLRLVEAG